MNTLSHNRCQAAFSEVERLVIGNHHCALLRDGSIACWGSNQFGEAGSPSTSPGFVAKPTRVAAIDGAVEVAIGGHHTCVRTRDGSVVCWDDQGDVSGPPERIEGVRAIEIAAGGMTSCARTGSTDLWCWGGAIGSRLQEDIPLTPKLVTLPDL